MQLSFVLPLSVLLLNQPHNAFQFDQETIDDIEFQSINENEISFAASDVFAEKIIHRNPEAALKTWANVLPSVALKELTAHAPEAVQGNSTFNAIDKLLEKGNVEENKNLVKALKISIVQEADQFFKVYMREYPNDLLEVFKEEPKKPILRNLSASSPHTFLKNIFRAYGLEPKDTVEEGSQGEKFVRYFVDKHPAESMETMMGRNDRNVNEMWLGGVKMRRMHGNVTNVEDLKAYSKTIKDKNDGIFRELRSKIVGAVKEDRRNFFTHFSMFGKENVLIESIADFDANAYLKSLIQNKPKDFRVALLRTYQLGKGLNERTDWKEVRRKELEMLYFKKPSVRNFFKDLLENSFGEFKEVAEKMGYPKNKLTEKLKGEGRDWRKETKDFKDLMDWMRVHFKEFYTSLHKKDRHEACKHFKNARHNVHMINQLLLKDPNVLIKHLQEQNPKCDKANFVMALISDLTNDELSHLVRTNKTFFEDALKGLNKTIFKIYEKEFTKMTPKKFAEKYWVGEHPAYRYIDFYFSVYVRKYKEFVIVVHRALPDTAARASFRAHPQFGCNITLPSLVKVLLPTLVTRSDDFIDHLATEYKYEMVKTIVTLDRKAAFELLKNQNHIQGYEVNELKQLKKNIETRPDWLQGRIFGEGAKHQALLHFVFTAGYVQKHPKKVLDHVLKTYPYVFEHFLGLHDNRKLLGRLAEDYPGHYLKHALKAESVNRKRSERNAGDLREKHLQEIEAKGKIVMKGFVYEDQDVFMEEFFKEYTFEDYLNGSRTVDFKGNLVNGKKDKVHVEMHIG